jgi:nucleotide-binding universal stress UspA family protein
MYSHILAAVDLADLDSSKNILEAACRFVDGEETTLHVLTVVPDVGMPLVGQYLPEDAEERIREDGLQALKALVKGAVPKEVHVQHMVLQGRIYTNIITAADQIDAGLIVVGGHAPSLADVILGPNAARVVRYARQSVLVVRD